MVTILKNDNPEGTFFIASATEGPFFIEVSTSIFLITMYSLSKCNNDVLIISS